MDSQSLHHLQGLTIQDPDIGLEVTQLFIQRTSAMLEEICIENQYRGISEAITIMEALSLCPNLISLKIKAVELTVQLLNLIASCLPHLRRLSISCRQRRRLGSSYDVGSWHLLQSSRLQPYITFFRIHSFRTSRNTLMYIGP